LAITFEPLTLEGQSRTGNMRNFA